MGVSMIRKKSMGSIAIVILLTIQISIHLCALFLANKICCLGLIAIIRPTS